MFPYISYEIGRLPRTRYRDVITVDPEQRGG
jgi:hypothetical protein